MLCKKTHEVGACSTIHIFLSFWFIFSFCHLMIEEWDLANEKHTFLNARKQYDSQFFNNLSVFMLKPINFFNSVVVSILHPLALCFTLDLGDSYCRAAKMNITTGNELSHNKLIHWKRGIVIFSLRCISNWISYYNKRRKNIEVCCCRVWKNPKMPCRSSSMPIEFSMVWMCVAQAAMRWINATQNMLCVLTNFTATSHSPFDRQ